jgi:endogenous inhibitor of DNA gyrase (YacG/DUF329 family)
VADDVKTLLTPMALKCPTCKQDVLPRARNPAFPFCSQRCREVDLGRWLGEEFRIPASAAEDEDGEVALGQPQNEDEET